MEPVSLLLDTFVTLADRILNLQKTRFQDKKNFFDEIIQPLFEELEPVVSNYIDIFRKAKKATYLSSLQQLRDAIEHLEEGREVMLMTRIKVLQMAYQIMYFSNDEEVRYFVHRINSFFYESAALSRHSRTLNFLEDLKLIERSWENQNERELKWIQAGTNKARKLRQEEEQEIAMFIDYTLVQLESSWSDIARSYGRLKILSISSPNFFRKLFKKKPNSK